MQKNKKKLDFGKKNLKNPYFKLKRTTTLLQKNKKYLHICKKEKQEKSTFFQKKPSNTSKK